MEHLIPMVVSVAFFGSIVLIVKLVVENKTRRVALEKGLPGEDITRLFGGQVAAAPGLKWGLVLIGISLGLVIGLLAVPDAVQQEVSLTLCVFFAGVALVVYYVLAKKGRV